jgi:hypothetical protein
MECVLDVKSCDIEALRLVTKFNLVMYVFQVFLVPMRPRGNAVQTRQRHRFKLEGHNNAHFSRSHAPAWECSLDAPASPVQT